jgi:hypothetical protein
MSITVGKSRAVKDRLVVLILRRGRPVGAIEPNDASAGGIFHAKVARENVVCHGDAIDATLQHPNG